MGKSVGMPNSPGDAKFPGMPNSLEMPKSMGVPNSPGMPISLRIPNSLGKHNSSTLDSPLPVSTTRYYAALSSVYLCLLSEL